MSVSLDPTVIDEGRLIGYKGCNDRWKQSTILLAVINKISKENVEVVDIDHYTKNNPAKQIKKWSDLILIAPVICKDCLVGYRPNVKWDVGETYYVLFEGTTEYYPAYFIKHDKKQITMKFSYEGEKKLNLDSLQQVLYGFDVPVIIRKIEILKSNPYRDLVLDKLDNNNDDDNDKTEQNNPFLQIYDTIPQQTQPLTVADIVNELENENEDNSRKPIEEADGAYILQNYSGPLWPYDGILVEISSNWLKQNVFDIEYEEHENKLETYSWDWKGDHTQSAQRLLIKIRNSKKFQKSFPQVVLRIGKSGYPYSEHQRIDKWDLKLTFHCSHRNDQCVTLFEGFLSVQELIEHSHAGIAMIPIKYPCIHIKRAIKGCIRSVERDNIKFNNQPRKMFDDAMQNEVSEIHMYGNYSGSLHSLNQTKKIKSLQKQKRYDQYFNYNTDSDDEDEKQIIHPEVKKIIILKKEYQNDDLTALELKSNAVDVDDLGWIFALQPLVPSYSIYHFSTLRLLKRLASKKTLIINLDDMSNLTMDINGNRMLHSIFWLQDPAGSTAIPLVEFVCGNWKSKYFGNAFAAFNENLEREGMVPSISSSNVIVFVTDNYVGFIKYIIQVRNKMTVHQYYEHCLSFIKGLINTLPRTLVAKCQGHTSHDLAEYYSDAPNCKQLVKNAWDTLRQTADHGHWLEVISFMHFIENNDYIPMQNDCIPIIDPFKNVKYDINEEHREATAKYKKKHKKKKYKNKTENEKDFYISYEQRQEYLDEIEQYDVTNIAARVIYPVKTSRNIYIALEADATSVVVGFGLSQTSIDHDISPQKDKIKFILETKNVFTYPFNIFWKFVGSYSKKIYGRFGKATINNGRAEKANGYRRVIVGRKNATNSLSDYTDTVKKYMEQRMIILFTASKLKLAQDVNKSLVIAAGYKKRRGFYELAEKEKQIAQLITPLISKLKSFINDISITRDVLKNSMLNFAQEKNVLLFERCSNRTMRKHINSMQQHKHWSYNQVYQNIVLQWIKKGQQLKSEAEVKMFLCLQ